MLWIMYISRKFKLERGKSEGDRNLVERSGAGWHAPRLTRENLNFQEMCKGVMKSLVTIITPVDLGPVLQSQRVTIQVLPGY
jgi:hypothetical protein